MLLWWSDCRAQTSLEYLFVIIVALIVIATMLAAFGTVNNSTTAIALIKTETLNELNQADEFHIIENIQGPGWAGETTYFIVDITPDWDVEEGFVNELEIKLEELNLYSNVEIGFE